MLSFSELEFKWSVHVINVLNHYMLPILDSLLFTMIYFYHGSEKWEKTSHATTSMVGYMHAKINIAMYK